jgi:hypothetical protein
MNAPPMTTAGSSPVLAQSFISHEIGFPPDKSQNPHQDRFTERTPKRTPNGLKKIRSDKTVFAVAGRAKQDKSCS